MVIVKHLPDLIKQRPCNEMSECIYWRELILRTTERKQSMKCPHCGADLKQKDICGGCGRKLEPAPEIEIEYKDFKVSEYLEIRQKEHKTPSETEAGDPEGKQQGIPHGVSRKMPRTVAIILVLLALMAGAFYLWRFLAR